MSQHHGPATQQIHDWSQAGTGGLGSSYSSFISVANYGINPAATPNASAVAASASAARQSATAVGPVYAAASDFAAAHDDTQSTSSELSVTADAFDVAIPSSFACDSADVADRGNKNDKDDAPGAAATLSAPAVRAATGAGSAGVGDGQSNGLPPQSESKSGIASAAPQSLLFGSLSASITSASAAGDTGSVTASAGTSLPAAAAANAALATDADALLPPTVTRGDSATSGNGSAEYCPATPAAAEAETEAESEAVQESLAADFESSLLAAASVAASPAPGSTAASVPHYNSLLPSSVPAIIASAAVAAATPNSKGDNALAYAGSIAFAVPKSHKNSNNSRNNARVTADDRLASQSQSQQSQVPATQINAASSQQTQFPATQLLQTQVIGSYGGGGGGDNQAHDSLYGATQVISTHDHGHGHVYLTGQSGGGVSLGSTPLPATQLVVPQPLLSSSFDDEYGESAMLNRGSYEFLPLPYPDRRGGDKPKRSQKQQQNQHQQESVNEQQQHQLQQEQMRHDDDVDEDDEQKQCGDDNCVSSHVVRNTPGNGDDDLDDRLAVITGTACNSHSTNNVRTSAIKAPSVALPAVPSNDVTLPAVPSNDSDISNVAGADSGKNNNSLSSAKVRVVDARTAAAMVAAQPVVVLNVTAAAAAATAAEAGNQDNDGDDDDDDAGSHREQGEYMSSLMQDESLARNRDASSALNSPNSPPLACATTPSVPPTTAAKAASAARTAVAPVNGSRESTGNATTAATATPTASQDDELLGVRRLDFSEVEPSQQQPIVERRLDFLTGSEIESSQPGNTNKSEDAGIGNDDPHAGCNEQEHEQKDNGCNATVTSAASTYSVDTAVTAATARSHLHDHIMSHLPLSHASAASDHASSPVRSRSRPRSRSRSLTRSSATAGANANGNGGTNSAQGGMPDVVDMSDSPTVPKRHSFVSAVNPAHEDDMSTETSAHATEADAIFIDDSQPTPNDAKTSRANEESSGNTNAAIASNAGESVGSADAKGDYVEAELEEDDDNGLSSQYDRDANANDDRTIKNSNPLPKHTSAPLGFKTQQQQQELRSNDAVDMHAEGVELSQRSSIQWSQTQTKSQLPLTNDSY